VFVTQNHWATVTTTSDNTMKNLVCFLLVLTTTLGSTKISTIAFQAHSFTTALHSAGLFSQKPIGESGYTTERGYSRFLRTTISQKWDAWWMEQKVLRQDSMEDGYAELMDKRRSLLGRLLKLPYRVGRSILRRPKDPGTLILIRHGESEWNANQTFTGWADPDLNPKGWREAEHAARLLLEGGYEIDVVFTSRLKRAIRTVWILLSELQQVHLPVFKSWRLQERCYGALTGLSKKETAEQLGAELVQQWRSSYTVRPPPLSPDSPYYPGKQRQYADLTPEQIPLSESLQDCMLRTIPIWKNRIQPELKQGRNVLVVGHANTLRGLVKTIDQISDDNIQDVALPTGIPVIYKFDKHLEPLPPDGPSQIHTNGLFLEKPGLLKEALKREEEWANHVPGYDSTMARNMKPLTTLERSLYKLKAERELGDWAGQFIKDDDEDDGSDGNNGKPIVLSEDSVWETAMESLTQPKTTTVQTLQPTTQPPVEDDEEEKLTPKFITNNPCVTSVPTTGQRKNAVLVIIRHGKTEHNKLKLFTGWEDAPLAPEGIDEARAAGRLLKLHGFEFDVVYTSWLSRAIETAWYVLDEMDELWLPLIKTWRLNERMYGVLTGLSKTMVKQRHGDDQFLAWRRGYDTPPPPVSSFSVHYPGNDKRYQKYLHDVRYSFRESLIRTIESGRITLRRKLPKSESLKDCMDRTIPFYTDCIVPEALNQGKRVLISSSENAIRGLLMHLCDIPPDKITGLEIPNGLPLIFDLNSKCIKVWLDWIRLCYFCHIDKNISHTHVRKTSFWMTERDETRWRCTTLAKLPTTCFDPARMKMDLPTRNATFDS
jgi:2,3-bisphosphoglycerate-dependent phosphoglycerate mutase